MLNLAAGLDTRPYRLPLPADLRWAEVDLPAVLDYKDAKLKDERPHCLRESVRLDLNDVEGRRALFSRLGAVAKKAVAVSEGLLVYLSAEQVGALADDLHAPGSFRWWIIDLASPVLLKRLQKTYGPSLAGANAVMQFAPQPPSGLRLESDPSPTSPLRQQQRPKLRTRALLQCCRTAAHR